MFSRMVVSHGLFLEKISDKLDRIYLAERRKMKGYNDPGQLSRRLRAERKS